MEASQNKAFVIYSLPGDLDFKIGHQLDFKVSEQAFDSTEYWVMKSFDVRHPQEYLRLEHHSICSLKEVDIRPVEYPLNIAINHDDYITGLSELLGHFKNAREKVVISRVTQPSNRSIDIQNSLQRLRESHPQALIYYYQSERYGAWIGATPETLLSMVYNQFKTMALAGTRWGEDRFTQKEQDEQRSVTSEIARVLSRYSPHQSDVFESSYGDLRHLRTDFTWETSDAFMKVVESLHPTPAVCGLPKEKALHLIDKLEIHDRRWYTGYCGLMDGEKKADLFVNLRCVHLIRDSYQVYVGGGINSQSTEEEEWEETERKRESIEACLVYHE